MFPDFGGGEQDVCLIKQITIRLLHVLRFDSYCKKAVLELFSGSYGRPEEALDI